MHSTLVQAAVAMTTPEEADRSGARTGVEGTSLPPRSTGASTGAVDFEEQRLFASVHGRLFGRGGTIAIGRYLIERRLGAGAMGEVFLGRDPDLDREVAIKLVHAHLVGERWAARLRREAKALARLAHPNVVHVYEVGEHAGQVFLGMEHVRGCSLRAWIAEQRPAWPEVLAAYVAAGRGLAAAHGAGLTHRDFKPDNVLRADDGRILVVDFGLARLEGDTGLESAVEAEALLRTEPGSSPADAERSLSRTGEVKGTPAYMPPEQFRGQPVDARADQFAFCVALYEGLWGVRPFAGSTLQAQMTAILDGPTAPSERKGVPEWVWPVLARGLAHEASGRWPSMEALLAALDAGARRQRQRRRWAGLGLTLGVTASAAGVAGAALWSERMPVEPPCEIEGRELDGVWDATARRAIEEAFVATAVPWAADGSRRVGEALDAWQAQWVEARVQVCEARRAGDDSLLTAQQHACLHQRRGELGALVAVLRTADAAVVREAIAAVGQLGEPRGCLDDPAALVMTPAPAAEQRAEVSELDRQLDGVEAMIRAAQYDAARDALVPIEPAVELAGHDPLRARWLELRGRALLWGGEREPGVAALERAADLAEGARDDGRLASAWRYLALHAMSDGRDPARGAAWLRRAEASARRLGVDPARSGELATIRGHHRLLTHELEAAAQEFRTAIADLAERGRTQRLVDARRGLGNALLRLGQPTEALAELEQALAEAEQSFGPHHPMYGEIAYDIGAALLGLGRTEEAQARLHTAIMVWAESHRGPHPDLGMAHILLAGIELDAGRAERAAAEVDAAEGILRATRPAGHPELGDLASARAAVASAQLDFSRARQALDEVIGIYREAFGAQDPYLAKVTADRGWVYVALGDVDAAELDFAAADAILRTSEEMSVMRTSSLVGLSVVATSRGRNRDALGWLEQVRTAGRSPQELAEYHLWSAVVHGRLGHGERAREHLASGDVAVAEATRIRSLAAAQVSDEELARIRDHR